MSDEIKLPHTVELRSPLTWGKETITEVVIERELNAGDLADVMNEAKPGDQFIRLVSAATGWPDPQVKVLSARDVMAISGVVQSFLPDGLGIGK